MEKTEKRKRAMTQFKRFMLMGFFLAMLSAAMPFAAAAQPQDLSALPPGSQAHLDTLAMALPDIAAVVKEYPHITFLFALEAFGQSIDSRQQTLDLGAFTVADMGALTAVLDCLPALTRVDMFESRVTAEDMAMLSARYPGIFFGWTIQIREHTIRTDATAFSTLHNNRSPQHSSLDFEPIKYCKHLRALDLGHNAITDISFIRDLKELRVLILAINQIEDISVLSQLPRLEYVELFKNKIRDISALSGMRHLLDLNICFNYVQDYGPLFGLSQLRRLWLYNSNNYYTSRPVPKDVVAGLTAALPNCHIDSTHYSTLGGWREHPRYFVIFDIFKNSVYQPFAPEPVP